MVSRAPLEKLQAYRKRMGWETEWVSSLNSDFNFDYHVSFTKDQLKDDVYYNYEEIPGGNAMDELPGLSVFVKDDAGQIYHTYSSYARGNEEAISAFYLSRPDAEGPQRERDHGLGEAARRIRCRGRCVVLPHGCGKERVANRQMRIA